MVIRFTLMCPCGAFYHDVPAVHLAPFAAMHPIAVIYPSEQYADAANDVMAEAEWIVSL